MAQDQAMEALKVRLERIAGSKSATDARTRAAMALAIADGVDIAVVRRMAEAVGLHLPSTS